MTKENNGKATIQKLYDEIIPIVKDIAIHTVELVDIKKDIENIQTDMKSKISIRAFVSWLTSLSIVVGIIITVIAMR
ncbi:MAG TPA: hypothetical protein VMV86_00580 [Methanosarcinales archaeon]|nr:hypothetical protein [Methanosarcinales archaeon]